MDIFLPWTSSCHGHLPVMDIFLVDLKFCHIRFYILQRCRVVFQGQLPNLFLLMIGVPDGGMCRHNLHRSLPDRCDSSNACRLCRLEPLQPYPSWSSTFNFKLPYISSSSSLRNRNRTEPMKNGGLVSLTFFLHFYS